MSVIVPQELQNIILEVLAKNDKAVNYVDALFEDLDRLPEPERTHALRAWFNAPPSKMTIKLVTSDGKPMTVNWQGDSIYVAATGRVVDRVTASYLLRRFGAAGTYRGKHQATGHTPQSLMKLKPEEREYLVARYPELETPPVTRYLLQERADETPTLTAMLNNIESRREEIADRDPKDVEDVY